MTEISPKQWGRVIAQVEPATVNEVASAIAQADVFNVEHEAAQEAVKTALAAGTLVEQDDGGMYPTLQVDAPTPPTTADTDDHAEPTGDGDDDTDTDPDLAPGDEGWSDVDFATTESDVWATTLTEHRSWLVRRDGQKKPFAPWGGRDHPDVADEKDARYSWSVSEHWGDKSTADEWVEKHPGIEGHAVILDSEADPYTDDPDPVALVDGDNVRDPETGDVHPAYLDLLDRLGLTYADVSRSGAGIHALYEGQLPADVKQATFDIDDEPWGDHDEDDLPSVEIYDGKRVCVVTGEHVPGTPADVAQWDSDALDSILDEHVPEADRHQSTTNTDNTDTTDPLAGYEPTVTGANETTDDARDMYAAVESLRPADLPLRTTKVDEEGGPDGWEKWDPSSYRTSGGNDSLHRPADETVFYDQKTGHSFGLLDLFAAEQGIVSKPWHDLSGDAWIKAVDTARDAGAPIPEYDGDDEGWQQTVALPSGSLKGRVWDWKDAGQRLDGDGDPEPWLTRREVQKRVQRAIERACDTRTRPAGTGTIVAAVPGLGKSHGMILAVDETGATISLLTGRGRDEQYQQVKQWCEDTGLDAKVLPAVTEDCPTFAGEHGEEIQATVRGWYENGATGKDVHKYGDRRLDHPLPCQDGGHCPYTAKWDFDPEEYDVLIGHPTHVHVPKVATGRTPVFDEFTDDFEHALVGERLTRAVTRHLKRDPELPFENYTDLIEHRSDDERRTAALARLAETGIDRDHEHAFEDDGHALAPLATTVLLASAIDENQHENGFSTVELPGDGAVGTFYPEWGQANVPVVKLLLPPDLTYANGVVGLDGTTTEAMWQLALNTRFTTDQVLDDDERRAYLTETADIEFVVTNDHARPVGGKADDLPVASAKALARAVRIKHDAKPDLVTTGTMHGVLAGQGAIDEPAGDSEGANGDGLYGKALYHGNLKGSNRLKHSRVGIVEGSTHYGDEFVKKWAAFAGENAERGAKKGLNLSYGGGVADDVLRHMREHQTLQGALRFGRDGNGATVYVNTNTLPEWVPTKRVGGVLTTKGDSEREVIEAMTDLGGVATRTEIQQHEDVSVSRQSIERVLNRLSDDGRIEKEWDSGQNVYTVAAFGDLNEHGDVDLLTDGGENDSHDDKTAYRNYYRQLCHRVKEAHGSDPVRFETDGGSNRSTTATRRSLVNSNTGDHDTS
jgi:hypothetical protein